MFLTNKKWIKLVFESRNQCYGAFELRKQSVYIQSKSLGIAIGFFFLIMLGLLLFQNIKQKNEIEKVFHLPRALLKDKGKQINKAQIPESQSVEVELPSVANWVIYDDKNFKETTEEKYEGGVLEEGVLKYAIDLKTGKSFVPEKAGTYQGGYDKLYSHILNQIKFKANPDEINPHDDGSDEIDYEINTMIWIQCELNEDGTLANATIFKGASDPKFNDRVLEAVKSSSDWIPAQHKGKRIKQTMIIPFHFNYMQPQFKYYTYGS